MADQGKRLSDEDKRQIERLRASQTVRETARLVNVNKSTVQKYGKKSA